LNSFIASVEAEFELSGKINQLEVKVETISQLEVVVGVRSGDNPKHQQFPWTIRGLVITEL